MSVFTNYYFDIIFKVTYPDANKKLKLVKKIIFAFVVLVINTLAIMVIVSDCKLTVDGVQLYNLSCVEHSKNVELIAQLGTEVNN